MCFNGLLLLSTRGGIDVVGIPASAKGTRRGAGATACKNMSGSGRYAFALIVLEEKLPATEPMLGGRM